MSGSPVEDRVVLLDEEANVTGWTTKIAAHRAPATPHLAFSLFLFAPDGSLLLQRRATSKGTFPGLWSNSCCSHPRPGETVRAAARRRAQEELGLAVDGLEVKGAFWYEAGDGALGESEYDVVVTGQVEAATLHLAPEEVAEVRWVRREELPGLPAHPPEPGLTPWFEMARELALGPPRPVDGDFPV